jgi:cytochrome c-type biogenesis protein CcmH/NrfG
VAIVVVVVMENLMAKRTENDENLKKYQARMEELKRDGGLVPSPELPPEKLIQHLAAEGAKLLAAEEKTKPAKVVGKIQPKKTDEVKLTETLGLTSKNPYIRARIMVLQKYPAWRRSEIGTMEQNGDINNKFYEEFVREVAALGDKLSSTK